MDSLGGFDWERKHENREEVCQSWINLPKQLSFSADSILALRGELSKSLYRQSCPSCWEIPYIILKEKKEEKKKKIQDSLDSCSFRSRRKYPLLFPFFIKSCHVNLVCCLITHFEMESVPSCSVPCIEAGQQAGMQSQAGSTASLRAPDADQKKWLKQLGCTDPLRKQITHLFALP